MLTVDIILTSENDTSIAGYCNLGSMYKKNKNTVATVII